MFKFLSWYLTGDLKRDVHRVKRARNKAEREGRVGSILRRMLNISLIGYTGLLKVVMRWY